MNYCELCDVRIKKGKAYCPSCEDGLAENEACDNPAPAPAKGAEIDLTPGAEASAFLGKIFGF